MDLNLFFSVTLQYYYITVMTVNHHSYLVVAMQRIIKILKKCNFFFFIK